MLNYDTKGWAKLIDTGGPKQVAKSSDEAGCKSTSDCEDYKKSIRQEVKPVPGSNEPERINTSKEHSAFRNAQPRQSESGDDKGALLVEMLIARKRHLASESRTLRRHNSAGRSRRASEVEFDPLSNVSTATGHA